MAETYSVEAVLTAVRQRNEFNFERITKGN